MEVSAWSSGLTQATKLGAGITIGVITGNPLPAIYGAFGFSGWLIERWQEAKRNPSPAKQPSTTIQEQINSVSHFGPAPEWFQEAAAQQVPTRQSDEGIVRRRAAEIARSPNAGRTDFDNRIRAVIELKITQRAAEIARSPDAGSDFENWLRAERELKVAQRAEEIANSPKKGTDYDNWVRAEYEVDVAQRAEKIAHSPGAGDDKANWYRAEHELAAEHAAISKRAQEIARSRKTAIEIRTYAEIMLRAEDIARSPSKGSDFDNWIRAEEQYKAFHARIDAYVQSMRGQGSRVQQERRAEIMVRAEDIARSSNKGTDFDNWKRAEEQYKAYRARLNECVKRIAASPEAALGHWLKAQQELVADGRIPPR